MRTTVAFAKIRAASSKTRVSGVVLLHSSEEREQRRGMTPLITAFGAMAARKARKLEATRQVLEEKIRLSEEDPKRVSQEVLQRVAQKMDIGISTLRKYWTECSKTDKSRESQLESTKRHKFHDVQDEEGVVFGIEDLVEIIASINNSHHQRQSTRALSAP